MPLNTKSLIVIPFLALGISAPGGVIEYGDKDLVGFNGYGADPVTGASLENLTPGSVTYGAPPVAHTFPFTPSPGDYAGTDQIFAGSGQTGAHDGYSATATPGPLTIQLDYSPLVPIGETVGTFTLGIGADDFQFPTFGQAYVASINGVANTALTNVLNSIDQTGPTTQFFSIGIDPALLTSNHVLILGIDQLGDGGDGWAVDFLTVGVTTVPEPSSMTLFLLGFSTALRRRRRN